MSHDDDDPPFPPCHAYAHSPPCRCCSDHRQRIRQLLTELDAMRSTAAKSMAMMTERVISDAMVLEPSWLSCGEERLAPDRSPEEDMFLKKQKEEEERKSKEEAEANVKFDNYTIIKVARDQDLKEQIGKNICFDLADTDKIDGFCVMKYLPFTHFKKEVAKIYAIPVQYQRYWFWVEHRPIYTLLPCREIETVASLEVLKGAGLYLFLEVELGRDLIPLPPPTISRGDILIFFKLYEPEKMNIRYVGRMFVKAVGMPLEILSKLNGLAGFSENEEIELFEELEYKTDVLCKPIDKRISFKDSKLEDGGIICFQKATISESKTNYRYPDIPSFLEYAHNHQVVHFRHLKEPKEEEFCLELSKLHTYDDVVERVANHLELDNPSKIRLTAHDWTLGQPKYQPIGYRGFKRLADMLIDFNKTSETLYYEVLPIPLPQMKRLSILKVIFHHSTKNEAVGHHIILPKNSCVGDVISELESKVELSRPNAELRLLEVFNHTITEIFHSYDSIEYMNDHENDQYWYLRAEEIPEQETNPGPLDRLIHVYHFMKDPNQGQRVQNFGEPFLLVIGEGETLADLKKRIQKKLQVEDQEYSKWRFAFLSMNRFEYLKDSDVMSDYFQRTDVQPGAEYLGLEHTDTTPEISLEQTSGVLQLHAAGTV